MCVGTLKHTGTSYVCMLCFSGSLCLNKLFFSSYFGKKNIRCFYTIAFRCFGGGNIYIYIYVDMLHIHIMFWDILVSE